MADERALRDELERVQVEVRALRQALEVDDGPRLPTLEATRLALQKEERELRAQLDETRARVAAFEHDLLVVLQATPAAWAELSASRPSLRDQRARRPGCLVSWLVVSSALGVVVARVGGLL